MARRCSARTLAAATATAAGAATAQLGLGYGLGAVAWVNPAGGTVASQPTGAWSASSAWTVWIAAISVVLGALAGARMHANAHGDTRIESMLADARRGARFAGPAFMAAIWRLAIVATASAGAMATVPLVVIPARAAQLPAGYTSPTLAGVNAATGVGLGALLTVAALTSRAVAANILVSAAWLWVLAIVAVADAATGGQTSGFGQLSAWKFTDSGPVWHSFYVPGSLLTLVAALLIGGLAAFPAAVRGDSRVGVAISGGAGPIIVAIAYILADPVLGRVPTEQLSAALTAPYAVMAGLAGSFLVTAVGSVPLPRPASLPWPAVSGHQRLAMPSASAGTAVPTSQVTPISPAAIAARPAPAARAGLPAPRPGDDPRESGGSNPPPGEQGTSDRSNVRNG
jgi:hypothetical protein